jgi:hypothetical protein
LLDLIAWFLHLWGRFGAPLWHAKKKRLGELDNNRRVQEQRQLIIAVGEWY